MSTMKIPLPDSIKAYVDQQVSKEGYGASSEVVLEPIRRDQDRSQLPAMMLKGLESPVTGQVDAAYFQTLRKRAEQRKTP